MPIIPKGRDKEDIFYELVFNDDLSLEGKCSYSRSEYAAFNFRNAYERYTSENDYLENMESQNNGLTVKSFLIHNLDSIEKPIQDEYEIQLKNAVTTAGDLIYFTPLLHHQMVQNPFLSETREYPVDYGYKESKTIALNITIPKGYEVSEVPKQMKISLPEQAGYTQFSATVMGDKITVLYKLVLNKTLFLPTEYKNLKEFYNLIIKKQAEPIIFKKVG